MRDFTRHRARPRHRRVGHAEPAEDLHLPPDLAGRRSGVRAEIVKRLATQAFRGAPAAADLQDAMAFYEQGREKGDFETGIRLALQAILASPRFVFRFEEQPAGDRAPGHELSRSPTPISPRGCRSSCGARCPTPSC